MACAPTVERVDWTRYEGPGAAELRREEVTVPLEADPLEPVNRAASTLNDALIVVADPVARAYRFVVPRWVRERVQNFGSNLVFPRRLAANLLQAKGAGARDELVRFGINTTAGFLGFFDPATAWGYPESDEDFGQVFASWGWRPSTYLVLPLLGPSSLRDALALAPDAALDPATYFFPAGPVLGWNDQVDWIDDYRAFIAASADPYADARLAYSILRNAEAIDFRWEADDTAPVQSLQVVLLAPHDEAFATKLRTGSVTAPATGRSLPYSYRMQPEPAPLVMVLPGLGTHRLGSSSLALAELAWDRGFSVVIVSSALNFEFATRASSLPVPGHAPIDAADLHGVLDAIDRTLVDRHPGRITARVLMGYSLGAFHAFHIAARGSEAGDQVRFDRYLTLDAPVSLHEGLHQLDAFFNAPLVFPREEREREVRRILHKGATLGQALLERRERHARYARSELGRRRTWLTSLELPLTDLEARFLIGLAFRRTLRELIWSTQQYQDLGVLRTERRTLTRNPAYEEIDEYSYEEYFYAFLLPALAARPDAPQDPEALFAANDLRALEPALRANGRIRHFANGNDFLTRDADAAWLADVLGRENVLFFREGGHLGNLHRPEVQDAIMAAIADLLPPPPP